MDAPALSTRTKRLILLAILVTYLALGGLYAILTPLWQAPDEPAHYNYVMHIVENGRLPILSEGDYPVDYLEEIKAARFPAGMSIESIRYESHQPPLYYALAAGVVRASDWTGLPAPLRLRLLGVALGAIGVALCSVVLMRAFPRHALLALGAAAFYATLPQHIAMTAAINSDALVEVLVNLCALVVLAPAARHWTWRRTTVLGVLLGLALLTKMQSYVALAFVGIALAWDARRLGSKVGFRLLVSRGALLGGLALIMALPWLVRNTQVYDPTDLFGLANHDQVVTGQLTTAQYVAEHGWQALATAFARTTFQSFWGQFGWMGVVLPQRVYQVLGLISGMAILGCLLGLAEMIRHRTSLAADTRRALLVLGVWALVTAAGYAWWNTRFMQHQGRYLFPALTPLAAAFFFGLCRIWRAKPRRILIGTALVLLVTVAFGLIRGDLPLFTLAAVAAMGAALAIARPAEKRWPMLPLAALFCAQAAFALACLPLWIIPNLTP